MREKMAFDASVAAKEEALREVAAGMLGGGLSGELNDADKARLAQVAGSDGVAGAKGDVPDHGNEARAESRRKKGNDEFKDGNWMQAMVYASRPVTARSRSCQV